MKNRLNNLILKWTYKENYIHPAWFVFCQENPPMQFIDTFVLKMFKLFGLMFTVEWLAGFSTYWIGSNKHFTWGFVVCSPLCILAIFYFSYIARNFSNKKFQIFKEKNSEKVEAIQLNTSLPISLIKSHKARL